MASSKKMFGPEWGQKVLNVLHAFDDAAKKSAEQKKIQKPVEKERGDTDERNTQ